MDSAEYLKQHHQIPQNLRTPGEQRDPPPPRTNVQIKALPQQHNMTEAVNQAMENYAKAIEKKPPPPLLPQSQEAQMVLREAPPPQVDVRNIQAPPSKKAPPTQPTEAESTEFREIKAPPPILEIREDEIMTPESVGISKTKLNLTSRSGRHVIKHRMESLGYQESDYQLETLYNDFLTLADKKGQVFDDDLEALVFNIQQQDQQDFYHLQTLNVQSGGSEFATSSIKLALGDEHKIVSATGNGPVDALYRAIKKAVDIDFDVSDYKISNKGEGEDGLGKADIVVSWQGRNFHGYGLDTDVIKASGNALVNALNGIHRAITIAELKTELKKDTAVDAKSTV